MTKRHQAAEQNASRIWIALIVVAAIAIVLGLKFYPVEGPEQTTAAVSTAVVSTAAATVTVPEAPMVVAEPQPATQVATTSPDQQPDNPTQPTLDPFPDDPLAQIAWVQRNQKPAMILFHSTTCIPCKQMEELVAKVHDDYEPDVYFVDVITNDKANANLVRQAGIQAIPTTFFVSSQGKGKRNVGAVKEDALRAQLDLLRQGGL